MTVVHGLTGGIDSQGEQLVRLPLAYGGCDLGSAADKQRVGAYVSASRALSVIQARLSETMQGAYLQAACDAVRLRAASSFPGMLEIGLVLCDTGKPARAEEVDPAKVLQPHSVGLTDYFASEKEILGLAHAQRLAGAKSAASHRHAALLNSTCDPLSGQWLVAPLCHRPRGVLDAEFAVALRWRLGQLVQREGASCGNVYSGGNKKGECCGKDLDGFGDHAARCAVGPMLNAAHGGLADFALGMVRAAGFCALREQVVPQLGVRHITRRGVVQEEDRVLDVDAFGHSTAAPMLLDVTLRHSAAASVRAGAAQQAGHAFRLAERQKAQAYPAVGGIRVSCIAVDTFGAVSDTTSSLVALCARLARLRQQDRAVPVTDWWRRWTAQLSWLIALAVARSILRAGTCIGLRDAAAPDLAPCGDPGMQQRAHGSGTSGDTCCSQPLLGSSLLQAALSEDRMRERAACAVRRNAEGTGPP